jgi:hypothetical protein
MFYILYNIISDYIKKRKEYVSSEKICFDTNYITLNIEQRDNNV